MRACPGCTQLLPHFQKSLTMVSNPSTPVVPAPESSNVGLDCVTPPGGSLAIIPLIDYKQYHDGTHSPASTLFPTSCLMTSWISTSAKVLKSCRNFLFLSAPLFSSMSKLKSASSWRHSWAMLAAFSEAASRLFRRAAIVWSQGRKGWDRELN